MQPHSLKSEYLKLRGLLAGLKRINPNAVYEGGQFPVRARWAVKRLALAVTLLEEQLLDDAWQRLYDAQPILDIARDTGLPIRKVKALSKKLRLLQRDRTQKNYFSRVAE